MISAESVRNIVESVIEPSLRRRLLDLGLIRDVEIDDEGKALVAISVPAPQWPREPIAEAVAEAMRDLEGVGAVEVDVAVMADQDREGLVETLTAERRKVGSTTSTTKVIAVSSGKGGVGKSSVTANTAVALARAGHDTAVVDADVWGYSIPRMLGVEQPPLPLGEELIIPPEAHGVRAISMDFFVSEEQAVIWRGPMLHKALEQFLGDVYWDEPEFLLIDMPPGTGDVAISISQFAPRARALLVTTPQPTAQRVARRAALMADKVNQEVLGVVENMSWFTGDDGTRYEIFGSGGGAELAAEVGAPLLGRIPLVPALREGADAGDPVAVAAPGSEAAEAFDAIAAAIVESRPRVRTHPDLVIG